MSNKGKVEQARVRGRNMHDTLSQIVENYHSANGWAIVRVMPTLLNFEVLMERSTEQSDKIEDAEVVSEESDEKPEAKGDTEATTTTTAKKAPVKKATTTKKATEK